MKTHAYVTAAAIAIGVSGCGPFGGSGGELGHGEFFYQCIGDGDTACSNLQDDNKIVFTTADGMVVPLQLAVGAPFEMIFQGDSSTSDDDTATTHEIEPASSKIAVASGQGFAILEPGTVSFLARGGDGKILDFVDITAEAVDTIALFRAQQQAVPSLELVAGDSVDLTSVAQASNGTPLAGGLLWGWSLSKSDVVALSSNEADGSMAGDQVHLDAKAPGETTLTIATGGKAQHVKITVSQ